VTRTENTATVTDTSREWHDRQVGFRRVHRTETDEEAFERHVIPEIEVLLRVARSLTRNHAEAEDLVQDTLIRAYRGIGGFDGRYPRAWLLTILRNTHINRNRRRRPELLRDQDATFQRLESDASGDRADVLVEDTIDGEILAALDDLSDDFRRVVELVDIDGLSYPEAAEVLGIPVGTVMSRLHRARRRIRDRLDRAGLAPRFQG
jgi:RNA polymerase sigma-70 factor (ECF subfamily)